MLFCCSKYFQPDKKIVLPSLNKLFRSFEFGFCPHCNVAVSKLLEQNAGNYEIFSKTQKGIKARRDYAKVLAAYQRNQKKIKQGTAADENFYYGVFRKTRKKDEKGNPVYLQLRKNFNNKTEVLCEVKTVYL